MSDHRWSLNWGSADRDTSPYWWAAYRSPFHGTPGERGYSQDVTEHCQLYDTRTSVYGEEPLHGPAAGLVTISGGVSPDVEFMTDQTGEVYRDGLGAKWAPGDLIRITGTGADVPPFEFELTLPAPVDFLEPNLESLADDELVIDVSEPFVVSWVPTDETVDLELWQGPDYADAMDSLVLSCQFPGEDGIGELPFEGLHGFEGGMTTLSSRLGFAHTQFRWGDDGGYRGGVGSFDWLARNVLVQ